MPPSFFPPPETLLTFCDGESVSYWMEGRKRKRVQHNRVDSNQSAKYSAGTQLPHCSLAALNELSLANNDLSPSDNIPLCTTGGFKSLAMVTAAECIETLQVHGHSSLDQ